MDKVQGRSWWSLVTRRFSPQPQASDFGDMGDTIGLEASLSRDHEPSGWQGDLRTGAEPAPAGPARTGRDSVR